MILPLIAAMAIVAQSTPTLPTQPSPSPSSSVSCQGRCFAGIAIGDDKYRVLKALGSQVIPGSDDRIMGDFNSYPDGTMLSVYYQKSIVAISITGTQGPSKIADPYGVRLNDSAEHLSALRGKPDEIEGSIWRYGPADNIHWDYTIENGLVTTILLSSVPKLS